MNTESLRGLMQNEVTSLRVAAKQFASAGTAIALAEAAVYSNVAANLESLLNQPPSDRVIESVTPSDESIARAFYEWWGERPEWQAKNPADTWIENRAIEIESAKIDAAAPEGAQAPFAYFIDGPGGFWTCYKRDEIESQIAEHCAADRDPDDYTATALYLHPYTTPPQPTEAAAPTITRAMWESGHTEYVDWIREAYLNGSPTDDERERGIARAIQAMIASAPNDAMRASTGEPDVAAASGEDAAAQRALEALDDACMAFSRSPNPHNYDRRVIWRGYEEDDRLMVIRAALDAARAAGGDSSHA